MIQDIQLTDLIQLAYDNAKKQLDLGKLPISEVGELCHVAYIFAFGDIYRGKKSPDYTKHYSRPIDELYKLFDKGAVSVDDSYSSFSFCYLRVFEIEGVIKHKTFLAQFEFEKKKHSSGPKGDRSSRLQA